MPTITITELRDRIAAAVFVIVTIVAPASIGLHASFRGDEAPHAPARSSPSVIADHGVHYLGDVPVDGNPVEATFTLTNEGAGPVRMTSVTMSCACVAATLRLADRGSEPPFGEGNRAAPAGVDLVIPQARARS